jgi:hypothetical protein
MRLTGMMLFVFVLTQAGCTAHSLRRHTITQAGTWTDIPYRQVMENLAIVANNPDALPCYSVIDAGTTTINDTFGINGLVNILPKGAGNGTFDPNAKRSIGGNWVLTQVTGPEKLRALHLAFKYGVYYEHNLLKVHDHRVTLDAFSFPRQDCMRCQHLPTSKPAPISTLEELPPPTSSLPQLPAATCVMNPPNDGAIVCEDYSQGVPGYYFNVSKELETIPRGWLHKGTKKQVPKCARFTAHCCDTYVWVNEDGMDSLSRFTLAIQDIARKPTEMVYAPAPALMAIKNKKLFDDVCVTRNCDGGPGAGIDQIQLPIDCYGHVIIQKIRGDAIQTTDSKLKSALSGVIKSQ